MTETLKSWSSNLQNLYSVPGFCSLISFILEGNLAEHAEASPSLLTDAKDKDTLKKEKRTKGNLLSHDPQISFSSILSLFHPSDPFINPCSYSQYVFLCLDAFYKEITFSVRFMQGAQQSFSPNSLGFFNTLLATEH